MDPRTLDFWEQPLNPFSAFVNSGDLAVTKATEVGEALFGPDLKGRSIISEEGASGRTTPSDSPSPPAGRWRGSPIRPNRSTAKPANISKLARTRKRLENEAAMAAAEATEEQIENLKAMVEGLEAYNDAVAGTEWESAEIEGAITAIDKFADAHFGLAEIAKNSADAEQALADSVKENGKAFDFGTEAGLKNLDAIEGVAEAVGVKLASAYDDADGNQRKFRRSAKTIADETLGRLREEMGLSEEQTAALAEALGLMPEDIETRYELSGTEEAQLKLDLLSGSIDGLPDNVETKVTQKIIAGDYQGALDLINEFYKQNPAIVPVKLDWAHTLGPGGTSWVRRPGSRQPRLPAR